MRILLKLKAEKDCSYDLKYFNKLQGFLYNIIKESEYSALHDKKGYKFFCFSNIFPIGDIKTNDKRKLIISSPDKFFIKILGKKLEELASGSKPINIGEMLFRIENIETIEVKMNGGFKIISATPIIIRIPAKHYEKYGIPQEFKKNRYVYWIKEYPVESFIKQLNDNLFKKYNEFYRKDIEEFYLFEKLNFKKEIWSHININEREIKMVGSIWEFMFSSLSKEQKEILEFGLDCGLGERNTLGFGFVNVIKCN
ncbi:MAG: CRISPR-associated endoribonuclease Cas6 [Candidatus Diapherotrites archaeon]